ncbi:histone deacetylase 7 isoform X2 [Salmo salar]|uniref:Histone deacetylase n=1 Tax=Salmo salar TaxID=8030 RepID=A0A1S3P789_SALSA|nr:histone deacetylase 7-like isoform X2 [Salmo salar]|eukprot:XP_014023473.1 PREDICTED: histone deacetylase 7-like [Salmo salar]
MTKPNTVDVQVPCEASSPLRPEWPMDLRTQRLVRPEPDSVMLAPHHSLFLGAFSAQHCSQDSQKHLPQHIHYAYDMEQSRQEKEQDKRQEIKQLMYKDKSEQSAVASPLVKQKLRSQILKRKEQATLEKTASNPTRNAPRGYRELAPDPDMPPKPHVVTPVVHHPPSDQRKDTPLRRTASDPLLKVRSKQKHINSRQNPLQRKTNARPTVKPRMPDTLDSSPSSSTSSTPVSGCSSPNDSLLSDSPLTTGLTHVAQRLLLQDGTLAHFMVPCSTALPSISTGLPGHGDRETGSHQRVARVLPQVYLPMERHSAAHHHLQPMFILEPSGLLHTQLVTVRGLNPGLIQYPSSRLEGLATLGPHRPLGRTRSEPPLPSHQQHQLLQQNHNLLLERLKQNTHLDQPRLTQIPSEDTDPEETRSGEWDGYQRSRKSGTSSSESMWDTESSRDSHGEHIRKYTPLMNQSFHWEQSRDLQVLTERRRQVTYLDPLGVPVVLGPSHRPLGRAKSSPASTSLPPPPQPTDTPLSLASTGPETPTKLRFTTGLVYDSQMLKHQCTCGDNSRHPEHAGRIQSIWSRLQERGLRNQCECIRSRKASLEELQSVHSEKHILLYGTNPLKLDNRILSQRMFVMLRCGGVGVDNDTIWNEMHTSTASRLAAGSVTELALRVAQGELKNGFAVVRPPGHHAAHSTPLGFCFFNSVAIAAKQLQHKLSVSKILIVDWDVHHGNGTQSVFYNDPSVLYISLHRYDNGKFFPGSGDPAEVGVGAGEGFNVNVAWTGGLDPPMGDAEYLAAFRTVVMPIAYEFCPDVVLVSSGFDAVEGHLAPLGGYKVSAKCFGILTRQLMGLAGGRVVMALEGGHELTAICNASEACVRALLGIQVEPLSEAVLERRPCPNAVFSLQRVIQAQGEYWRSLREVAHTVDQSYMQAQGHSRKRGSEDHNDTVSALASLSMASLTTNRVQEDQERGE